MKITSEELREKYLSFFKEKNHEIIDSASLIPENDPTVLFTMAGMHPLVPYLAGEKHPKGSRLANCQKCIRTGDIEEVGDNTHCTFFEMLGNWSLGDYFKEDSIKYSYEFLTDEKYLNIPKDRLYFTVFEGDDTIPKDTVSYDVWRSLGVDESHITYLGKKDNFWILGSGVGPCGPDTEIFYDTLKPSCSSTCGVDCDCGKYVEIWNNVFMQYNMNADKTIEELKNKNVDTGLGLDRVLYILNDKESVYDTDLFSGLKTKLEEVSGLKYEENVKSFRIVMDHLRTSVFILGDQKCLAPSNTGAGYVLRRLIRRMVKHLRQLNIDTTDFNNISVLANVFISKYKDVYSSLGDNEQFILSELEKEVVKFNKTINDGMKMFNKLIKKNGLTKISGEDSFKLFDTYGFALEFTMELAEENNIEVDVEGFEKRYKEHQEKSRTASAGQFKGGLADDSYETVKYHTLAHIMLASLKEIFSKDVVQKGANITAERIRFDFSLDHKMTDEEKSLLTTMVNEKIKEGLEVKMEVMPLEEARKQGAEGMFSNKYDEVVKVYSIGEFSKEICGGPHVSNSNELGEFVILKEESSSSGVRRIKAILK